MERESEHEITIPNLLILHKNGKIIRFEGEQGLPPSISSSIQSKDILVSQNLKARLFLPNSSSPTTQLPLILFFHGGGFVSLSPTTPSCHSLCCELAIKTSAIVISVDYRLAPEHRLPAAFEDGFSSLLWVKAQSLCTESVNREPWLASRADFSRLFLAGCSSGASIAHHVAAQACGSHPDLHLAGLVLVVPFMGGQVRTQSELELGQSSTLPLDGCDNCWALSLPHGASRDHPFCNFTSASLPLWSDKSLPWPPTLVVMGGRDILRDRQAEYTQQLRAMGRDVTVATFDMADHFMSGVFQDLMLEEMTNFILLH